MPMPPAWLGLEDIDGGVVLSAFELTSMGYGFTMMNATEPLLPVVWEPIGYGIGF
jgi:hypothetical protein